MSQFPLSQMFNLTPVAPLPLAPPKTTSEAAGSFDAYLARASERPKPLEAPAEEPPIAAHSASPAKANEPERESSPGNGPTAVAQDGGQGEGGVEDDSTDDAAASPEAVMEDPVEAGEPHDEEDELAIEMQVAAVLPQVPVTDVDATPSVEAEAGGTKDAKSGAQVTDAAGPKNLTHAPKSALQSDSPATDAETQPAQEEPAEAAASAAANKPLPQAKTVAVAASEIQPSLPETEQDGEQAEDSLEAVHSQPAEEKPVATRRTRESKAVGTSESVKATGLAAKELEAGSAAAIDASSDNVLLDSQVDKTSAAADVQPKVHSEQGGAASPAAQNRQVVNPHAKTTSKTPGTSESAEIDRVRFVQRVARAFQAVGNEGGQVRLRLSPPELGSLRLEVTIRGGVMTARLEAETSAARTLLLEHLPVLRERLAEQNIKVERFEVDLMGGQSGEMPDQAAQDRPHDRAAPQQVRPTGRVAGQVITEADHRASPVIDSTHVNVVV